MKRLNKTLNSWLVVAVAILVAASVVAPAAVQAALPAPSWLPGQPMLAGTQVIAMWLPVPGAVKYFVYLNGTKIMESPANQYIGPAPGESGEYRFEVSAVDAAGAEGAKSQAGMITIRFVKPPSEIIHRADAETKTILLRWPRPEGAVFFNLFKAAAKEGPYNLLTSTQDDSYTDREIEHEKTYYYKVTSKDVGGAESKDATFVEVLLPKLEVVAVAKTYKLKAIPTRVVRTFNAYEFWPVDQPLSIKKSPDGDIYIAEQNHQYQVLDGRTGGYVETIDLQRPEGVPLGRSIGDFVFNEDASEIIAADQANGIVYGMSIVGSSKGQMLWHTKLRYPTLEENAMIRNRIPPAYLVSANPGGILLRDDDILIADLNCASFHVLDRRSHEQVPEWITGLSHPDQPEGYPFDRITAVYPVPGTGKVILVQPLAREFIQVEAATLKVDGLYGAGLNALVGGFVGGSSLGFLPDGKRLVVADTTMHHLQVFDSETMDYLFTYSNEKPTIDPNAPARPVGHWQSPRLPFALENGDIVIYQNSRKNYMVIHPLAEEPVELQE